MALEIIPIDVDDVAFRAQYLLDDGNYEFKFYISQREDRYWFDLLSSDGTVICHGQKVIPGPNLLQCMGEGKPPGALYAVDQSANDGILRPPKTGELGKRVLIMYLSEDDEIFQ